MSSKGGYLMAGKEKRERVNEEYSEIPSSYIYTKWPEDKLSMMVKGKEENETSSSNKKED
jgi:hypothetical protein